MSYVATKNARFYLGEDKTLSYTVYQSDRLALQSITGWSARLTVHKLGDPSVVYFVKDNTTNGGLSLITSESRISILIVRADTINMNPNTYQLLLERIDDGLNAVLNPDSELTLRAR